MINHEYIKLALTTESKDYESISSRASHTHMIRVLHAVMGLSTEANELLDIVKKHIFYGKFIDISNIEEESGDLLWFLALLLDAMHINPYHVMEANIAKLKARYGDKFDAMAAIDRNLDREKDAMDSARVNFEGNNDE